MSLFKCEHWAVLDLNRFIGVKGSSQSHHSVYFLQRKFWPEPSVYTNSSSLLTMTTLNSFANQSYTAEILEAHGVSKEVSTAKATLFAEAAQLLQDNGVDGSCAAHAFFIPGRVEVLGKHTDYAGGRSLIMAISKAFCVLTVDRNDNTCRFFSTVWFFSNPNCDLCMNCGYALFHIHLSTTLGTHLVTGKTWWPPFGRNGTRYQARRWVGYSPRISGTLSCTMV